MQKVSGKEGLWRLEAHEKLLGVRCTKVAGAMPPLADGTCFSGAFGVVGGRAMSPKPASGGMYIVHMEGERPCDQAMRLIAYLDVYGRVFACDDVQLAPPARTPDLEIARLPDLAADAERSQGYVYVRDVKGDPRCVAAYSAVKDRYTASQSWFGFRAEDSGETYKEFMTRMYLALAFRPAMGAPAVPSRGAAQLIEQLSADRPLESLVQLVDDVRTALSDPALHAPGAVQLLIENLEAAGLAALRERKVAPDSLRLVRSTKYAHMAYLARAKDDADVSDRELWGIEAAINRFQLLCERLGQRADEAALEECRRVDAALFSTFAACRPAGGMPESAPQGRPEGEWGLRCRLAVAIEQLRLPVRVDVELALDAPSGLAAFGLTVPPCGLVPALEGRAAADREREYVARVGVLLAAHSFATEPAISEVRLLAWPCAAESGRGASGETSSSQQPRPLGAVIGALQAESPSPEDAAHALFEVSLTRELFDAREGFEPALAGDIEALLEAAGAKFDVAGAKMPRERVVHPVFEAWGADIGDADIPQWAQGPLGASCERDLDIEYDTAYRRVAEELADKLVAASSATDAIAIVREVQSQAIAGKDERAASACTRLMCALAEGSLDVGDQNAVVGKFLGEDRCLVALGRANALAETDPEAAVSALTDAVAEAQLLDGFVDGSREVYRGFDSYAARVMYNVSRATGVDLVPGAARDAGLRVRVAPDSFYLCNLEVTHLLERSFERSEEALRYGRAAVEMAPATAMGYRVLGRAYMLQGDMEHARDVLVAGLAVSLMPTDIALMYYQLGYVLWKRKEADAAVACYLKAVEASPQIAMQATAELHELVSETGAAIPSAAGVEGRLRAAGIPCAPSPEALDAVDAALAAACDAGLAHVARSLLATRLRHRPDDALMGVLRSFGEPR